MQKDVLSRALVLASSLIAVLLLWPVDALPQANGAVTKGSFVERFFVNRFSRSPNARNYVPANVESLPPAERYAAVVKGLSEKGVVALVGSQPGDPLTRVEYVTLTYILAGGPPGKSLAEQKEFLRSKGVVDRNDIGFIKTYQGDVTVTRSGQEQAQKITGAEPVLFRDVDETAVGAKVELQFDDGSVLSIGEDTAITIDEMVYDPVSGRRSIQLRMTVGTIKVNAAPNTHPESRFNVVTPSMVAGVRGTVFAMIVNPQGATKLITLQGLVGARPLRPGESRPRTRTELQQTGGRAGATTQAPPAAAAVVPGQAGQTQEVVVAAGQTTEVSSAGAAPTTVQQATQQDVQQVNQATAVTAPAQTAAVTTTQVQQTNVIVTTAVKSSAESAVQSKQESREQVAANIVQEDKGQATVDTVEEGKDTVGGGSTDLPTTATTGTVSLTGLTGDSLKTSFLKLTDTQQAEEFGKLTSSQQADLAGRLTQDEAEALLGRFKPSSPFTETVLKSLFDFGVAFEDVTVSTVDNDGRTGTLSRVGTLLDKLTPEQALEFANCEQNYPSRRCVGSNTSAGNFSWFQGAPQDDDLTANGAAVATALSRRLDLLATSGGVLPVPGSSLTRQMILATAAPDDVIPADTVNYVTFFNGYDPWFVGGLVLYRWDLDFPVPILPTHQALKDVWGGEMRPAAYSSNGGYQAGQLRSTAFGSRGGSDALIDVSGRVGALNNNGFLSYAVQVEEDLFNSAAKAIYHLPSGASIAFPGTSNLASLVDSQLIASDIRAKDAFWQTNADARAGLVFFNSEGRRVRAQQYVYRPAPDEVRMVSVTVGERRSLNYIDLRATFHTGALTGLNAIGIRDLPWNAYFSVFYTDNVTSCASSGCSPVVASPLNKPLLSHLRMEIGREIPVEFLREELSLSARDTLPLFNFDGNAILGGANVDFQYVDSMKLTVQKTGAAQQVFTNVITVGFDPRLGANNAGNLPNATPDMSTLPIGEYRVRPARYFSSDGIQTQNPGNPPGFNYFARAASGSTGIVQFGVRYGILGDATTSSNVGLQTSLSTWCTTATCTFNDIKNAPIHFDTIWDSFRVNLTDSIANPQGLPTISIGANILGLRLPGHLTVANQDPFSMDIRAAFIPFPRMIWRGEPGF